MTTEPLHPIRFHPVFKDYIWGGRHLANLGRELPPGRVAESWEIAAHTDGTTRVANGPWSGTPLTELQRALGIDLVGRNGRWALDRDRFPLLIKLLDANRRLSVQVHPDNDYAQQHEGNELGKSEMWVVLSAEPDAAIIYGVRQGANRVRFREALKAGTLEQYLHRLPVQTGDVVCVPAGTLHAILGGLVIAEIQQNSNTTYRVYDWNRLGADGRPRALHVDKALDVINFDQVEPALPAFDPGRDWHGATLQTLCRNDAFVTERLRLAAGQHVEAATTMDSLEIWSLLAGAAQLSGGGRTERLQGVAFALLPAAMGAFGLMAETDATLLRTTLPQSAEERR